MAQRERIEAVLSATDNASKAFGAVTQAAGLLGAALRTVAKAVVALGALTYVIDRFARSAERLRNLSTGFDTLSQRIDTTANEFLPALREATLGMVDDLQLMEQANQAVILGVAKSQDEFAELAEKAVILGRAMGRDASEAIQDVVVGIGRQSRQILDNLGIVVKAEEAYESYATSIGKTKEELTETERRTAFMTAAIKAMDSAVIGLSGEIDTLSGIWITLRVQVVNAIQELTNSFNKLEGQFKPFRSEVIQTAIALAELGATIEAVVNAPAFRIVLGLALAKLKQDLEALANAATIFSAKFRADMEEVFSAIGGLGESPTFDEIKRKLQDLEKQADESAKGIQDSLNRSTNDQAAAQAEIERLLERNKEIQEEREGIERRITAEFRARAELAREIADIVSEVAGDREPIEIDIEAPEMPTIIGDIEQSRKELENLNEEMLTFQDSAEQAAVQIGDAFVDAAFGARIDWEDFLKRLIADIIKAQIELAIMNRIAKQGPAGGGAGGSSVFGLAGFGIGAAIGGPGGALIGGAVGELLPFSATPAPSPVPTLPPIGPTDPGLITNLAPSTGQVQVTNVFQGAIIDETSVGRFFEDHPEAFGRGHLSALRRGTING